MQTPFAENHARFALPPEAARRRTIGYTLMELLVAMTLLVLLGGGLVTLLNQAVRIWRTSEERGRVYEKARAVLEGIAGDLRSVLTTAGGGEKAGWARFVADEGPGGRQCLRFVRTISGETAHPILREGGRFLSTRTPAVYTGSASAADAAEGLLAAPGGAMEVLYMMDPQPGRRILWRGVRAPVGGPASLLVDDNLADRGAEASRPAGGRPGAKEGAAPESYLAHLAAPVARGILFVGFRFWGPTTNTWDGVPPLARVGPGEKSGPLLYWDSTRALLDTPGGGGEFRFRRAGESLADSSDDLFPRRVEVVVVVPAGYGSREGRLAQPVSERDDTLVLTDTIELPETPEDRFVRVEDEWMAVKSVDGYRITLASSGRGRRWTRPARHDLGALVEVGVTFRRVVEIPSVRTPRPPARGSGVRAGTRRHP